MELLRRKGSTSEMAKMSAADLVHERQERKNHGLSEIEKKLHNWKLPKFDQKDVYRKGRFEFRSDNSIKTEEGSVSLSQNLTKIQLFSKNAIMRLRQKHGVRTLHWGLFQIGIKPVSEEGLKGSVLVALRECKIRIFHYSLLGIVESSLCNGPIFFNCRPNYYATLMDDFHKDLTLNVKVHGCNMMQHGKSSVEIIYRVHYKLIYSAFDSPKAVKSDPRGKTLLLQTNIHKPKSRIVPRIIEWGEIEVPDEWRSVENEEEGSTPVPDQNEDPDPQVPVNFPRGRKVRIVMNQF